MPPRGFAFGRTEDAYHPDTMRAALSEFLATAIFVFAAEGSVLSLGDHLPYMHSMLACMHPCLSFVAVFVLLQGSS